MLNLVKIVKELSKNIESGRLTKEQAINSININEFESALLPNFIIHPESSPLSSGEAASPGAATGRIALSQRDVDQYKEAIFIKEETQAEDVPAIRTANGTIAIKGGVSSHTAIIARGYGKPGITGCSNIKISSNGIFIDEDYIEKGDYLSFKDGNVYYGKYEVNPGIIDPIINNPNSEEYLYYNKLLEWITEILKNFSVKSNSDDPISAKLAKTLGAKGIGVVRTEHMFFDTSKQERLHFMLEMLMADSLESRKSALYKLYDMQVQDFIEIFREVKPYQITIRLLDPPLHEFIPNSKEALESLAVKLDISTDEILRRRQSLKELDPMMGHRGIRLGISYPEIYEMQVRAIFEAAKQEGIKPEIMLPLVADPQELKYIKSKIINPLSKGYEVNYSLACMIEVPRITEESIVRELATLVNTLSFGTNDLTQYTFGMSRSDLAEYLEESKRLGIFTKNIFTTIDRKGVGSSMIRAIKAARSANLDIDIGICGEHGGDPESIDFFIDQAKVNYVSCSPYRVPVALLAAAQTLSKY